MESGNEDLSDWEAYLYEADLTSEYPLAIWTDVGSNSAQGNQLWVQPRPTSTSMHPSSSQREATTMFIPVRDVFYDLSTFQRTDPSPSTVHRISRQPPRFEGDLYTALWVKGEGTERAGWCGFCSSWHKLRDSNFNYHIKHTHGIIRQTGKQIDSPQGIQCGTKSCHALCGMCGTWLDAGHGDIAKLRTMYFRHAHKCYASTNGRAANQSSPPTR